MTRKRIVALAVALCILIGTVFFFYIRADVWFYIEDALRFPAPLALSEVSDPEDAKLWHLETLMRHEDVTVSNSLLLVNREHPLPKDYEAVLEDYNGARMHPLMVEPYVSLRDRVEALTDVRIYVSSDYRTKEEQEEILAESPDGIAAGVGCSEHEAGLALDVYAPYYAGESFLRSPAGRSVNRICSDYGFIIRYPRDKEEITGISYEPWHLRYVGAPHAALMTEARLTLEEYIEALTPETWFSCDGYLILRTERDTIELPTEWEHCEISPDNTGYTVITLKMSD